ncbi:hypothetical protein BDW74DRAFT_156728 [Aspergillus multicolor]|uniref:glutamate--tRNA ligase MSE1 n=1 Tax=Aspergillus multicolor TaxID=41759 RepID=UPI003CCE52BC
MRNIRPGLLARRSWVCIQCRRLHPDTPSTIHTNKLPRIPVRTRFAPSPTGYLHLGSLRTALFNYLLAKRTKGQFILRIEDTDQKRTVPDAEQRLYYDLRWAGLQWDEGPLVGGNFGPYRQSERTHIYRKYANELIERGLAYRCFCPAHRLEALAKHRNEAGLPPGYDRNCEGLKHEHSEELAARGEPHVVRLKVNDRIDQFTLFKETVYGRPKQKEPSPQLDLIDRVYEDPILMKSDGFPTYHLANVIDDHLMEITHVIRGTEWMPSTHLHALLYHAFGWKPPVFSHVPLLVNQSGQKLSKRNADIDISHFKDQGILAEPLLNFAVLLGWSHQRGKDIFSLKELEKIFDMRFTRGNTIVAFSKLWFLQSAHAQRYSDKDTEQLNEIISAVTKTVRSTASPEELSQILQNRRLLHMVTPLVKGDAKNYTNAPEFVARNSAFFTTTISRPSYEFQTEGSNWEISLSALHTAAAAITLLPESHWTLENIKTNFTTYDTAGAISKKPKDDVTEGDKENATEGDKEIAIEGGKDNVPKRGDIFAPRGPPNVPPEKLKSTKAFQRELYHYMRWALLAGAHGPSVAESLFILGRTETLRRLEEARRLTTEPGALSPVALRLLKEKGLEPKSQSVREEKPKGELSWAAHSLPSGSAEQ